MKILSITAGAAGMYCGSCLRDNALAAELLRRGHDVTLMPAYTPTRTDEPNVSQSRVLFGGISVYLQQLSPVFRRLPRVLDRLWDAPAVIRAFTARSVSTDPHLLGDLTLSMLEGRSGALRREFEKLLAWTAHEPPPDVTILPNTLLIALATPLREAFGRPVCCTLQGEELFLDGLPSPYRARALGLIRQQVSQVDRFIAVSDYCARFMTSLLHIPPDRVSVVPLGINLSGYTAHRAPGPEFTVGYFARVAPEKGLHVLADAYVRLRRLAPEGRMRLEAAGYLSRADQPYLRDVRQTLERSGLGHEFSYRGAVDRAGKLAFLQGVDVLSVPATYDEPKGFSLLEAMASGVPVAVPGRGALVEIIEKTGGGVLVTPDEPDSLAEALHGLWRDRAGAERLGQIGLAGVHEHYGVGRSADRLLEVLQPLVGRATRVADTSAGQPVSVA